MREYEQPEVIRQKCFLCGCKNKKLYDIEYEGEKVGMTYQCCNCGYTFMFLDTIYSIDILNSPYKKNTNCRCNLETKCEKTECPLYGTFGKVEESPNENSNSSQLSIKQRNKPRFL